MMEKISQPKPELKPEEAVDERSVKFGQGENGEPAHSVDEPARLLTPECSDGGQAGWEKEMEEKKKRKEKKKKEHEQVDELDKLIKRLGKEKEEEKLYQKKKFRR